MLHLNFFRNIITTQDAQENNYTPIKLKMASVLFGVALKSEKLVNPGKTI